MRPDCSTHSRVITAMVWSPWRTGTASMRAGSFCSSTVTSPSVISPELTTRLSTACSVALANVPTQSVRYAVWPWPGGSGR